MLKTTLLFMLTALSEILGCYLPWLWLKGHGSSWLLLPSVLFLACFVWLLSLHPQPAARVYAAYGGVYIVTSLCWLSVVDGVRLQWSDAVGALICLVGMLVIMIPSRIG